MPEGMLQNVLPELPRGRDDRPARSCRPMPMALIWRGHVGCRGARRGGAAIYWAPAFDHLPTFDAPDVTDAFVEIARRRIEASMNSSTPSAASGVLSGG